MNRRERARLDLAMVVQSLAGRTSDQIAERYGVCPKTVQRAVQRVKQSRASSHRSTDLLDELWQRNLRCSRRTLFARVEAKTPRTRVAAIRVHVELLASQLEALRVLGIVAPPSVSESTTTIERVQKILLARAKTDGLEANARDWLKCATDDLLAEAEASSGESGQSSACAPPFATADHRARLSRGCQF